MKKNLFKITILLIAIIYLSGCAPRLLRKDYLTPTEKLAHQIDLQISEPELETAFLGIMVQSLQTGEILYQHHAKKMMMPASNEKIPTSATALVKFGPDFKYETKLYATGTIEDSVLKGDLVIVGSGDPTIGYRFCEKDTCMIFKAWAKALKKQGIRQIDGNLIGVDDVFDNDSLGYGWSYDDLSYSYSAQIGGLMLNENYATISITADSASKNINIKIFPDYEYLKIDSDLKVTEDKEQDTDIDVQRVESSNDIIIKGKIKVGDSYKRKVSINDPTLHFLSGFHHELEKMDIEVTGKEIDSDDLADSLHLSPDQLICTHHSPPFSEVIKILMKESQNLYAESFIKLLGHHFGKAGNFKEGERILKRTLRRFGLEEDSYQFRDGSGLSRYNYISPYHIVKILRGMYYHRYGEVFRNSLPIAGVDGTIGYRMKGTVAQGKIMAKTGTISNVRCLSGYAYTKDDEVLAFSIMANNFLCSVHTIMDLQDRICMLLSSFSRK